MSETVAQERFEMPSLELVQHAVRELGWDERLGVTKMSGTHGNSRTDVYNFPQLVNTLFGTKWNQLLMDGSKATLVWVNMPELVAWLRNVTGDVPFAEAVEAAVASEDDYRSQMIAIAELFRERVGQYRAVLDAAEGTEQ